MAHRSKSFDWHLEQRATIGGSTAPLLMELGSKYVTGNRPGPLVAYERMTKPEQAADEEESPDAARGRLFEDDALEILTEAGYVAERHNQNEFVYNDAYPWAHGLPDGWIMNGTGEDNDRLFPLEIKWPSPTIWRRVQDEGCRDADWCQCQHNMALTGYAKMKLCYFNCEFPPHFLAVMLDRDDEFIGRMMAVESSFFVALKEGTFERWMAEYYPTIERVEPQKPKGKAVIREDERAVELGLEYRHATSLLDRAGMLQERAKQRLFECCTAPLTEIREDDKRVVRVHNREDYRRIM